MRRAQRASKAARARTGFTTQLEKVELCLLLVSEAPRHTPGPEPHVRPRWNLPPVPIRLIGPADGLLDRPCLPFPCPTRMVDAPSEGAMHTKGLCSRELPSW